MNLKKSLLLILSILAISCTKKPKPEITTRFDTNFETLKGRVRQLSEISGPGTYDQPDTVITDFDIRGNEIQTRSKGDCNCLVKYEYRYDKNGKKTEIITHNSLRDYFYIPVYKYDTVGRIVEASANTKAVRTDTVASTEIPKQQKRFYKYDLAGNMTKCNEYLDKEHRAVRKYKYNDELMLIEEDAFSFLNNTINPDTITYQYQAFDTKGNWVKRLVVKHFNFAVIDPDGQIRHTIHKDTITRKITYY